MEKHKTLFIMNPNANLGQAWKQAADLKPIMEEFGGADWAGSVYPTHAIELARKGVEDGYDLIIAGGGDGTVHEVVNAIMEFPPEKRPTLGVVPLGSGNDFAHAVGMDPLPWKALRQIFTGQEKWIDIGEVKDEWGRTAYIDNTLGVGFDAIVTIYSHELPVVKGFMMYLAAVLKTIFLNHKPIKMRVAVDGQDPWEDKLIMLVLCNGGREGGGFLIYPEASQADGTLNYVTVSEVGRGTMLFKLLPAFMNGTHLPHPKVASGGFTTLKLEADAPLYIHIDGEVFAGFSNDLRKLEVKIHPRALRVLS
ncbi:MAG: diacylglycerol/lipid kinase family protein [Anaerolineales bacterium]|jgi:diacylglycerol kinase (ATP)